MLSNQTALPSVETEEDALGAREKAMEKAPRSQVQAEGEGFGEDGGAERPLTGSPGPGSEPPPSHTPEPSPPAALTGIPSGIRRVDERIGGLHPGGVYLVAGSPGPGKLVSALQFLQAGVDRGEKVVMFTTVEDNGIPEIAKAWGLTLHEAWEDGSFLLFGFRDDFELRVLRSAEPLEVLEQLQELVPEDAARVAFDPGSMFLRNGSRTLLGKAFLDWGRQHPATVLATLSVDSGESLPSSAEWLVQATDAVIQMDRRPDGLHQVRVNRALMGSIGEDDPITLQLTPGKGLTEAEGQPARRRADRPAGAAERLLLISLDGAPAGDLEAWANATFKTEIVHEPLEAVAILQEGPTFGGVLVHSTRKDIREAVQACRAIRPLTGAAVVFASDDALRSTDRVNLLESGADDCISGGVDFRELEARLRQAVSIGGKPPSEMGERTRPGVLAGGKVSLEEFGGEVETRSARLSNSIFSVVRLTSDVMDLPVLEEALVETVRTAEGDLVSRTDRACLVLLQGAREQAARAFLNRFRNVMDNRLGVDPGLQASLLASPVKPEDFRSLLASDG